MTEKTRQFEALYTRGKLKLVGKASELASAFNDDRMKRVIAQGDDIQNLKEQLANVANVNLKYIGKSERLRPSDFTCREITRTEFQSLCFSGS